MQLLRRSGDIFDKILSTLAFASVIVLVFMWLSVVYEVVMRYFFSRGVVWTLEVAAYSLVWMTFLGAAWALKKEKHVGVDIVLQQLSPKNRAFLNFITSVVGVFLCLTIAWYSGEMVWILAQQGMRFISNIEPLKAPIIMIVPVGTFLLFIQFIRRSCGYLRQWRAL